MILQWQAYGPLPYHVHTIAPCSDLTTGSSLQAPCGGDGWQTPIQSEIELHMSLSIEACQLKLVKCMLTSRSIGELKVWCFNLYNWNNWCVVWRQVRRICRTSIRAPPKLGPRQSIKLREHNMQASSVAGSNRSPRLQRRVNSLTNDDVISFTFSNYDADVDDNEKEHPSLKSVPGSQNFSVFLLFFRQRN